jgi:two-component system, response regulator YesN
MAYKIFLVEDEVVTREGVRENVDWQAHGFEFCGEAADGESALPLLQTTRPDVLITDIKMPFMDGLQLSKIVRERMPGVKIVILSGHDEFEFAQQAVNLGVTEYLLKPVTVKKLHQVLQKLAAQLDQEQKDQQTLKQYQAQIDENRAALRERLLLKLIMGVIGPTEAIEQGQLLGIDLIARCYLVVILNTGLSDRSDQFDYDEHQQVLHTITSLVENNPDVFTLNKNWEDLVLLLKGSTPEYLEEDRDLLLTQINREVSKSRYRLTIGSGSCKSHLTDISESFIEALLSIHNLTGRNKNGVSPAVDRSELLKIDKSAIENFLKCGTLDEFDSFFSDFIHPLVESALRSRLIKDYLFIDLVLAAAKLVNDLGGEIEQVIPELDSIDTLLANISTIDQLREQTYRILASVLALRDKLPGSPHTLIIYQAKKYIDSHYADPDLSLNSVAAQVNLSANHLSVVFSQETPQTFKEYLTEVRINKAKALLRTTSSSVAEIAYQVGYNDPHYFSAAFKKNTGLSPTEFRLQASNR